MRAGVKLLLESHPGFKVISEASDGHQAVENAMAARPDIAVLDIAMPKLSGIEAAQRIAAQLPQTAIIILSMHSDEGYVLRALKSSARGYLLKDSAESDLIHAITAMSEGKSVYSRNPPQESANETQPPQLPEIDPVYGPEGHY